MTLADAILCYATWMPSVTQRDVKVTRTNKPLTMYQWQLSAACLPSMGESHKCTQIPLTQLTRSITAVKLYSVWIDTKEVWYSWIQHSCPPTSHSFPPLSPLQMTAIGGWWPFKSWSPHPNYLSIRDFMDNLFRESQSCLLRLLNQHRVFTVGAGWAVGAQEPLAELTNW